MSMKYTHITSLKMHYNLNHHHIRASKFFNSLGFQPSSSYPHMSHLLHHRSCPFLVFPLIFFLPFSLLAPISSDHLPLQHVQSSSSFCPISFLLSFSFRNDMGQKEELDWT